MPETNRIAVGITAEDAAVIDSSLTALEEKMATYLVALSADDRRGLPKMKDKTYAFVQKTVDYTASDPGFVPDFMDAAALKIDFAAVSSLTAIFRRIEKLRGNLDDTILLSGSEAYKAALHYYNSMKISAKANVPGANMKTSNSALKKMGEIETRKTSRRFETSGRLTGASGRLDRSSKVQNPSSEHQNPCSEVQTIDTKQENCCFELRTIGLEQGSIHIKQEICCSELQTIGLKQRNPYLQQGLTCLEQRIWYPEIMTQTIYFSFRSCTPERY